MSRRRLAAPVNRAHCTAASFRGAGGLQRGLGVRHCAYHRAWDHQAQRCREAKFAQVSSTLLFPFELALLPFAFARDRVGCRLGEDARSIEPRAIFAASHRLHGTRRRGAEKVVVRGGPGDRWETVTITWIVIDG